MERGKVSRTEELLEKYFGGETSLAEEQRLRSFIVGNNEIPEEMLPAAEMLRTFDQQKQVVFPGSGKARGRLRSLYIAMGIAASVALLIVAGVMLSHNNERVVYGYVNGKPVTNYESALKHAQYSLGLVSRTLDKTVEQMKPLAEVEHTLEKIGRLISENNALEIAKTIND